MTTSHNRVRITSRNKGGGACFAVANGRITGIFFSLAEATVQIRGFLGANIRSFPSVQQAGDYLKLHGLSPNESGGWLSSKKDQPPLLYSKITTIGHSSKKDDDVVEPSTVTPTTLLNHYTSQQPPSVRPSPFKYGLDHPSSMGGKENEQLRPVISSDKSPHEEASIALSSSPNERRWVRKHTHRRVEDPQIVRTGNKKAKRMLNSDGETSAASLDDKNDKKQQSSSDDSAAVTPAPKVSFDAIQLRAIDAALEGKNVFLTGVAGTGKSLVTQTIVHNAETVLRREVACAAPTGVAAVNLGPDLGAQTVHSLAGVGVPQSARDFASLLSPWTSKKWRAIEVLVLDEIGMLQADFLDWLDVFVRKARRRPLEPFGGIQLIFVGDFAQLGPIPGRTSLKDSAFDPKDDAADCVLGISECAAYAFQSALWREANFYHVHLSKVYRQSNNDFVQALMDIREAKADTALVQNLIRQCSSSPLEGRPGLDIPDGIKPTILYCTNRNVDKENYDNLSRLQTEYKKFPAVDWSVVSPAVPAGSPHETVKRNLDRNSFFSDCTATKEVHLKVGAQVMLLQNLDIKQGLVNGSRGVVEAFKLCPVVRDKLNNKAEQLIGPEDVTKFPGYRFEDLKFGQETKFDGKVWRICRFEKFPLVRFMNKVSRIIVPETFERTLYRQGSCFRKQLPLRLAWALTIHKSQGTTLDLVVCDLQGCFTGGQAYVALSRARSMLGLQINNFDPKYVTADPLVEGFYRALDKKKMKSFLEDEAGLWWYPILHSPSWLAMFTKASNKLAKENSMQFREWLQDYSPPDGYSGWGSYAQN